MQRGRPITREHLAGDDVVAQARGLIGAEIAITLAGATTRARIVETEAYRGRDDAASHAFGMRRTKRTEVFFGPPGHAYVYLCYGIHRMFNVIAGPVGEPNAILVRAVAPCTEADAARMRERRGRATTKRTLAGGPGLVCQALGIRLDHNGADLFDSDGEIRLTGVFGALEAGAPGGQHAEGARITASARVGVDYAGEAAAWPWRFRESGSPYTSSAK